MKKLIFLLLFLLVALVAIQAGEKSWVSISTGLELGVVPHLGVANYKLSPDPEQTYSIEAAISSWEIFYTELRVELTFINTFFIEGGIRTYITKSNSSISFTPQTSVYDWKLGLRFFDGNLEIGWWHRCFHPSLPYMPILQYEITGIEGGFDQIYILFRAETPLIRRK